MFVQGLRMKGHSRDGMRLINIFLRSIYLLLVLSLFAIGLTVVTYNLSGNTASKGGGASSGIGGSQKDAINKVINFYRNLYGLEDSPTKDDSLKAPTTSPEPEGTKIETLATPQSSPSIERISSPGY